MTIYSLDVLLFLFGAGLPSTKFARVMESTRFYTSRASLLGVKTIKRQRKWTQGDFEKGKRCVLGGGGSGDVSPFFNPS